MPDATIDGLRLHYQLDGGEGPIVTLLGGLGNPLAAWIAITPSLVERGYRVLRIDVRGSGASDMPPGPYDTRAMATDVRRLLKTTNAAASHLVGLSLGGMIAQHLAAGRSARFMSVTLACTYAAPGPYCQRLFQHWDRLAQIGMDHMRRATVLQSFTPEFMTERPGEFAEIESRIGLGTQSADACRAQLAAARSHDARNDLARIAMPAMVLAGIEDHLIPPAQSRRLYEGLPNATWTAMPGGHGCLWEHPSEFADALVRFFDDQPRAARA